MTVVQFRSKERRPRNAVTSIEHVAIVQTARRTYNEMLVARIKGVAPVPANEASDDDPRNPNCKS